MSINPVFNDLFESYNRAIQEKCEQSMGIVKNFSDFEALINDARSSWEEKDFKGKLPSEFFTTLKTEVDFKEAFEKAAVVCDEFIPESFVKSIINSGHMNIIENHAFSDSPIDMKNAAIKILGISGSESYTGNLIELLYSEGEYGELLKETARQAIIDIGTSAIPSLEENLSGKDILSDDDFHLVIALIGIDSDKKTDTVFKVLKESFRKTSDKALAARCLADYGDGRAVPMLRSYLEKNLTKLEENTVFELQGAVLSLGGSTDGLDTPEKV